MGLPNFLFFVLLFFFSSATLSVAIYGEEKNRTGLKFYDVYRPILMDILQVEVKIVLMQSFFFEFLSKITQNSIQ